MYEDILFNNYLYEVYQFHSCMEAHHLIPTEFQDDFEHSIDVPENIISLCPTCHRLFHHASDCEKKEIIEKFFDKRSAALSFERGVMIKKDTLLRYYKV